MRSNGLGLRRRDGRVRFWVTALLLVAIAPVVTGCYGQFPLTKALYKFNGECSDEKVVQSVVLWVFVILPVYGLAMFADAVVLNLVEFWTGDTLEVEASTTTADGTRYTINPSADGREAVMTVSRNGRILAEATFVRVSDTEIQVLDADGKLAGKVLRQADGALNLTDARGKVVRTLAAAELAAVSGI